MFTFRLIMFFVTGKSAVSKPQTKMRFFIIAQTDTGELVSGEGVRRAVSVSGSDLKFVDIR